MSKEITQKINFENEVEKESNNLTEEQKTKYKDDTINPISLISKDLLNQINSLDEKDFGEKKESKIDVIQLDETQKESEENDEEDSYIFDIEKEMEKDNFGFEIFKKNPNEESNSHRKEENTYKELGRFSQPMPYPQKIMNFNLNQSDESNFSPPIGRFSYDCHQFDNKIDNFRGIFNNPLQNQLNFFNNSFSMNGKSGWVCPFCKNFNYESKSYYIIKQFFYKYSKN